MPKLSRWKQEPFITPHGGMGSGWAGRFWLWFLRQPPGAGGTLPRLLLRASTSHPGALPVRLLDLSRLATLDPAPQVTHHGFCFILFVGQT